MWKLTRESVYRGSLIQIYERASRNEIGVEQVVLIDWMDVTSLAGVTSDPLAGELLARELVDEFMESQRQRRRPSDLKRAA